MVTSLAASAFFPLVVFTSPLPSTNYKPMMRNSLHVKVNSQAPLNKNGAEVGLTSISPMESMKNEDETTLQNGLVFRQYFTIPSYDLDSDMRVSMAAVMTYFQETRINHVRSMGIMGEGLGVTREMTKRNLMWVVTRMHIVVDHYPSWGENVQIDTWCCPLGKNSFRCEWLVRDCKTGKTMLRATSKYMMVNKETRKLSRVIEEVRMELEPHFLDCDPLLEEDSRRLPPLDDTTVDYIRKGLTPQWNDLDANLHVNHVKYIGWILEGIPASILKSHELCDITLEYWKERGKDCVLQSLTAVSNDNTGHSMNPGEVKFEHLLPLENGTKIARGMTIWRLKYA